MKRYFGSFSLIVWLFAILSLSTINCFGHAQKSPPHGAVVSSVLVNPEEYTSDGGQYDLFLAAVSGGKISRLTNHTASPSLKLGGAIREPVFSHDGKRIVFLADYAGQDGRRVTMTGAAPYPNAFLNIWEVNLITRKVLPITKGEFGWRAFGWSPNDRFICAVYQREPGSLDQDKPIRDDIYVWNMRTGKGRKLVRVSDWVDDAFWSHDGRRIDYQTGSDANLYSVSLNGGKPKILIHGRPGRFGYSFSSDGRKVAYVDINTVYVADANGSRPVSIIKLIRDKDAPYWPKPRWSKDGRKLAIYELSRNGERSTKLHVYDRDIGRERVVATLQEFVTDLKWSEDGQWMILKTLRAGETTKPDSKTGWHTFHHEGLLAVEVSGGRIITVEESDEEVKGLDWFEKG